MTGPESKISDDLVKRGARAQVYWLNGLGYSLLSDSERQKYEERARLVLEAVWPEFTSDEVEQLQSAVALACEYDADHGHQSEALASAYAKLEPLLKAANNVCG